MGYPAGPGEKPQEITEKDMAKLKRYELYGDGETIPGEYTGPKRPADTPLPGKAP